MSEIEKAIMYWEEFKQEAIDMIAEGKYSNSVLEKQIPMCNTALDALREQAERSKGCEWCKGALPEDITPHREFFKNMLKGWSEDWLCVAKKVPSGEHILHCETDTALTDFSVDIPIRFCPMCGKRLEVEP